ncbi:MAG: serine/threonine-protein kinase [Isosphaeraceae bacterium]
MNLPTNPDDTIAYDRGDSSGPAHPGSLPVRGALIGEYELIGEIARGGMGVVFRARHRRLGRQVALKMILSGPFATPEEVRRFLAEAVAAASLEHDQIVTIYEVGQHLGYPYFTMKLVQGGSLVEHLGRFQADPSSAARLVVPIARAVEYAHRQGFVHRDLKPGNILIDDRGMPHVIDFGLAKRVGGDRDPGLTQHGATVGTPSYMAPEQAGGRGADVSATADVYGLGAILYELLTGRPPFRARTVNETVMQVLEREPEPPRRINPAVPRALEMIVLKCLEKKPDRRYPSAEALAADLERYLRGEPVEAARIGPLGAIGRWARQNPDLMARGLGIGSVLLITQVNTLVIENLDVGLHLRLTITVAAWLLVTLLIGWFERRRRGSKRVRAWWVAADILFATIAMGLMKGANTPYVLGYSLLIATSGLWNSTRLVWLTTALSVAGYLAIAYPRPEEPNHHPDIIAALLLVTGLVVAQHVRRMRALSAFHDQRMIF